MKDGIAMISKLSMPVNSFRATASTGTWVSVNKNVSTLRPSAIDTHAGHHQRKQQCKDQCATCSRPQIDEPILAGEA